MEKHRIFVYGTLRKHEKNHSLLENTKCLAEQAWIYGELYDTGLGYPAMKASLHHKTYGEVFEVDKQNLGLLDELEDYIPNRNSNLYERVLQTIYTDSGEMEAEVYVTDRNELLGEPILHGDWKLYHLMEERPEKVLYFAYGSCMDTERFVKAGVDHLFKTNVKPGFLNGYSMKYLFARSDGGRADIIEDGGGTEGIVYEIPYEGVEYLFEREGFLGGWYRPTFVDVVVEKKRLTNVLTFHVYNKRGELAPPNHYAAEILRGARGRLSEEYYSKLEKSIEGFGIKISFD
ncbi:gamma-glutamylcyclotransferase [Mesobacillus harenae]|uniref:gamma-glutamylcyclotransferase n=1 Tax=Mesobacillus harenae TaxID=2213203 RepID=UPI00157FD160